MRKQQEAIFVGDDVFIIVTEIGKDWVKLGIEAPKFIPVDREEVYLTKRADRIRKG